MFVTASAWLTSDTVAFERFRNKAKRLVEVGWIHCKHLDRNWKVNLLGESDYKTSILLILKRIWIQDQALNIIKINLVSDCWRLILYQTILYALVELTCRTFAAPLPPKYKYSPLKTTPQPKVAVVPSPYSKLTSSFTFPEDKYYLIIW